MFQYRNRTNACVITKDVLLCIYFENYLKKQAPFGENEFLTPRRFPVGFPQILYRDFYSLDNPRVI